MHNIKLTSWNVNSIRSRIEHVCSFLKQEQPDLLLLQELKCTDEMFPTILEEEFNYNIVVRGQKALNGVAILSKYPINETIKQLPGEPDQSQARYIECNINIGTHNLNIASVYVPNGTQIPSDKFNYKLQFCDALIAHAGKHKQHQELMVIAGDYNVAPYNDDVHDSESLEGSLCFHPEERKKFFQLLNLGYIDVFKSTNTAHSYTWWDYRAGSFPKNKGMRIDHIMTSPKLAEYAKEVIVHKQYRELTKPSDHAPISCIFHI